MAGVAGRSGRKKFVPNADQCNTVKVMKGLGIPEDEICKAVLNPQTRKPLSRPTLQAAFKRELESAAPKCTPWSAISSSTRSSAENR
jgi:hypothetical protein